MIRRVGQGNFVPPQRGIRDAYSYFSKATGQKSEKAGKLKESPQKTCQPAKIDITDRIKMSREMKEEPKAARGEIKERNPLNLDALMESLKMSPPGKKKNAGGPSLAEQLQMISMKSTGQSW